MNQLLALYHKVVDLSTIYFLNHFRLPRRQEYKKAAHLIMRSRRIYNNIERFYLFQARCETSLNWIFIFSAKRKAQKYDFKPYHHGKNLCFILFFQKNTKRPPPEQKSCGGLFDWLLF